jgi:drug/metabolite transporter (DMT)-like permease
MFMGVLYALLASFFWALSSLLATRAIRFFGPMYYNCLRLSFGSILLGLVALAVGGLAIPTTQDFMLIAASAVIGLTFGDLLLFRGFGILGARRAALVFMLNIPITALLGYWIFEEQLSLRQIAGAGLAMVGISMATIVRQDSKTLPTEPSTGHQRSARGAVDDLHGSLHLGVAACLLAALCQALGLLLLKPVLASERYSMPQFAMMRFAVAGVFALTLYHVRGGQRRPWLQELRQAAPGVLPSACGSILFGSVLGFVCYIGGISKLPASLAALLTSLSSIFVLPMLVVYAKQTPPLLAWLGAVIGLVGVYLTLV